MSVRANRPFAKHVNVHETFFLLLLALSSTFIESKTSLQECGSVVSWRLERVLYNYHAGVDNVYGDIIL